MDTEEGRWAMEYHLDNGAKVFFGPLRVTTKEVDGKLVMRVDMETKTVMPGMECTVVADA